ncbi:MAG TPA: right-handed parallel beta-helix repeat-containing protein [Chloroflexota bacterium]|nr:right-handed parallel beta-helix repeat-containing protein [Chloroflexota bacterium]
MAPERELLVVDRSLRLEPGRTYAGLRITASGVTVDGRGAVIQGSRPHEGIGISATGIDGVTLRNVTVRGFETGLRIEQARGWTIEQCDFSDNFHDPDFGWGDNGRRGGIVLLEVVDSVLRDNRANRVWDACGLYGCERIQVLDNDFSHASNTCLRLWQSSSNAVERNNFCHGIRISPGEVHARDSAGVLIEHASNDNRFLHNDATYGGDGFFIRLLNSLPSSGNYLEGNDASFANNNCFEAWAPNTTYVANRANHGSYGFWLGGSMRTVLLENEAAYNGDPSGNHNAPEPGLGHCGIVFTGAPSSAGVLRRNFCHHNNGAGIAIRGGPDAPTSNWSLEGNRLEHNRLGMVLEAASGVDLTDNDFDGNIQGDLVER